MSAVVGTGVVVAGTDSPGSDVNLIVAVSKDLLFAFCVAVAAAVVTGSFAEGVAYARELVAGIIALQASRTNAINGIKSIGPGLFIFCYPHQRYLLATQLAIDYQNLRTGCRTEDPPLAFENLTAAVWRLVVPFSIHPARGQLPQPVNALPQDGTPR